MKAHLFYTFLLIFIATAIITLLGITKVIFIEEFYLHGLFVSLIIELVGAVIGISKKADFFGESGKLEVTVQEAPHLKIEKKVLVGNTEIPAHIHKEPVLVEKGSELTNKQISIVTTPPFMSFLNTPTELENHIQDTEQSMPLFDIDKKQIASKYIGNTVSWDLNVYSLEKIDNENVEVIAQEEGRILTVISSGAIRVEEHPELRFLKKGHKIKMIGIISNIELPFRICLNNSKIHYIPEF